MVDSILVHSDGAARGNPGPAAIAYAVYDDRGNLIEEGAKYIGRRTNNEAEYEALIWAMERAKCHRPRSARFRSDSELVVMQVNGRYGVKEERMRVRLDEVLRRKSEFEDFELKHVRRHDARADHVDALANAALDAAIAAPK